MDFRIEIIKAVICLLVTVIPTYLLTDNKNKAEHIEAEKVEQISTERENFRNQNSNLLKENEKLNNEIITKNSEIEDLNNDYDILKQEYNNLDQKWKLLTSSSGASTPIEPLDDNTYIRNYKTGESIECHLLTKKMYITFTRVTQRGPLIELIGCENFVTENTTKIYENGKQYFLLTFSNPFKLQFTFNSCEDGADLDPSEIVVFFIKLLNFDMDNQTFEIMYSQKLLL